MKINTIMNIEVSSKCNNNCPYCPAQLQAMHREVGFMSMETFEKCMEWVKHFTKQRTQTELNLFGIGEPTMNPYIIDMVRMARNCIPIDGIVHMNTNGNKFTMEMAQALKDAGINRMSITDHKAYETVNAIRILQHVGIPFTVSRDAIHSPNNWAGQVKWFKPDYKYPCPWLNRGQVMIMWDGRVTTCCLDMAARGVVGTVDDDLTQVDLKPYELCTDCHQNEGIF
jgi:hypothetical protein